LPGPDWALIPLIEHVNLHAASNDILVVSPALHPYVYFDRLTSPVEWYGLLDEKYPPGEQTAQLLDSLLSRGDRILLARDRRPEADEYRGIERYLVENAYLIDDQLFENWSRLMTFLPPAGEIVAQRHALALFEGEIELNAYRLKFEGQPLTNTDNKGWFQHNPSAWLQLSLRWRGLRSLERDYTVFAQLLGDDNSVVWQRDRYPVEGFKPTSTWQQNEIVEDLYAIPLDFAPGRYTLIVGLYELETMVRLSTGQGDAVVIGEIEIAPASDQSPGAVKISVPEFIRLRENELFLPLVVFRQEEPMTRELLEVGGLVY